MVYVTPGDVLLIGETQRAMVQDDYSVVMLGRTSLKKLILLKKVEIMAGVHLKALSVLTKIFAIVSKIFLIFYHV